MYHHYNTILSCSAFLVGGSGTETDALGGGSISKSVSLYHLAMDHSAAASHFASWVSAILGTEDLALEKMARSAATAPSMVD